MLMSNGQRGRDAGKQVAAVQSQLAALPETERATILEQAVLDLPTIDLCGLILAPTGLENDLKTIMGRVRLTPTLGGFSGSVINSGETFTVTVKVRNCTGHDLRGVRLRASGSTFASVTGTSSVDLGDMTNASPEKSVVFQAQAIAVTPTPAGPAENLINLSLTANVDLRGSASKAVQGEVAVN
jgi:hypothetical protein